MKEKGAKVTLGHIVKKLVIPPTAILNLRIIKPIPSKVNSLGKGAPNGQMSSFYQVSTKTVFKRTAAKENDELS